MPRYSVQFGHMRAQSRDFDGFEDVLRFCALVREQEPRAIGAGYDCDCDEDGFHEVSDGLTDDEREQVESVLS